MYRLAFILALSFGLMACANNDKKISSWEINDVYQSTLMTPNADNSVRTYVGPPINTEDANNTYEMYHLKGDKSKQGVKSFELIVQLTYFGQMRYYESATLNSTPSTTFKVVSRDAGICEARGCIFRELLSISLSDAFLKDNAKKGFQLSISSKAGAKSDLFIPPQYIQGYLKAVDGVTY
jgi:hypothetical protein